MSNFYGETLKFLIKLIEQIQTKSKKKDLSMKSIADLSGNYQEVFSFFREYEKYFFDALTKEHILLINILKTVETDKTDFKIYTGKKIAHYITV